MPLDVVQVLLIAFVGAAVIAAYEVRVSLQPPVCPQCVHCRHIAAEKRRAEERALEMGPGPGSIGDDRDRDPKDRRH